MAFKGDLKNVQLADLFQTLAQNRQEGVLTLSSRGATHRIAFRKEGVTLLDPAIGGRRRIGEILVSASLIEEKDLAESLREQAKVRRFLGEILVEKNRIRREQLDQILALQVEEEMYELFRVEAGTFEFTEGDPSILCITAGPGVRPLPVDQVVFEAARRLDEWTLIQRVIPSVDGVYLSTGSPSDVGTEELAKGILTRLDGRHSVRDVADALLASPFVVAKLLAQLVERGYARPANCDELLATARALLTENQRNRALRFLHRIAELTPDPSPLDAQVAELFKLAGELKAAARMRVKLAAAAHAAGKLDSARHELEVSLKEWPGSIPALELFVEVVHDLGDSRAELQAARELAAAQTDAGAIDDALRAMERLLALAPDDSEARRRYADLCLRAHLKEKAIEVLEGEVVRLKRDGASNDLAAVYKHILSIDPGRKDIKRALTGMRRSRGDRLLRVGTVVIVLVALTSLCGFVGIRYQHRARGLARLREASSRLADGDGTAARAIVEEVLADDPRPEVAHDAMALLDQVDRHVTETTHFKRSAREEQIAEKLAAIQARADKLEFDTALTECVALLESEPSPYLADRVRGRMQIMVRALLDLVDRAKQLAQNFRQPERDEDVAATFARMSEAFPVALSTAMPQVREVALASAKELEGPPREWMHQVLTAVDAYELEQAKMKPAIEALRARHYRLLTLQQLSVDYLEAARAAESGNVERSRELLRRVLAEYGDGEVSGLLQKRLQRLDAAATALQQVEHRLSCGDYEGAYDGAHKAAEDLRDLQIPAALAIPVLVDSLPRRAHVRIDGAEAGTTPVVVRAPAGKHVAIDVDLPSRVAQHVEVDADGGARRTIELPRPALGNGRIDGPAIASPLHHEGRFAVAGRDGTLHAIDLQPDGGLTIRRFATGSISGSHCPPVAVPGGFVAVVFDGKVYRMNASGPTLFATWTTPLGEEVRFAPIVAGEELLVVTDAGSVVALALEDGAVRWRVGFEKKRIVGTPAFVQGRLFVPLAGGIVGAVSIGEHAIEFERPIGEEVVHGLVADGEVLVATTSTGRLLRLDPRSAEPLRGVELGNVAIDLPRVGAGLADVPLGKSVVRVALASMTLTNAWDGLAPTATPAAVDGLLWVPCDKGSIEVIDPTQGVVVERAHLGAVALAGSPVVTSQGIALLARDGAFVVLDR